MRKRKEKPEISKTMAIAEEEEEKEDDEDEENSNEANGFFSCYLLASACPRFKGHTYIGFTVNPKRRIRQHNGEIRCGAWRTKRKRPWEMVLCIHGFPTNVSALQFEWAWQHPNESLAVRSAAATFKSLSGVANKVKLAYTMLTLPAWCSLNITVNYFSTKYMKNAAGCPSLPEQMKVQVSPIDELPCYLEGDQGVHKNEEDWEFNREYEEICSFRVYGSAKEVSNEIPQTGTNGNELRGCNRELEDNERVPPSSFDPSYNDAFMSNDLRGCDKEHEYHQREPPSSCNPSYNDAYISNDLRGCDKEHEDHQQEPSYNNAYMSNDLHGCDKEHEDHQREPPSCSPSYIVAGMSRAEIIIEDGEEDQLEEEGSGMNLQQQPERKNSTSGIATEISKVPRCNNNGVFPRVVEYEVIDVSTPSPDCRTSSHRFKRRVTTGRSEIIDLTKSPTFIQL